MMVPPAASVTASMRPSTWAGTPLSISAGGSPVWVLDETVTVRDADYRPIMLQGFVVDVSDRHGHATLDHAA